VFDLAATYPAGGRAFGMGIGAAVAYYDARQRCRLLSASEAGEPAAMVNERQRR